MRDVIYTFIWSCMFGVLFYALGAFTGGAMPSLYAFGIFTLISNIIGYSIHALFSLGRSLGLDEAARRSGFVAKVIYFTAIPLAGVLLGLWLSSFVIDVGLRGIFTDAKALLSLVSVSLVVSVVLSVIFFWRERGAVADGRRERERGG